MPRKPVTDPHKAWNIAHHKRLEAYNKRIEQLLNRAITQCADLALRHGAEATKEKPFTYAQDRQLKAETERLLRDLSDEITMVTKEGEGKEWEQAYKQATEYLAQVYNVAKQTEALQAAFNERLLGMKTRNLDALNAFQNRKIGGLKLSDKVWNYTQDFEKQMEVAIDQALLEGKSAQSLSRDIRSLLIDPDALFRRVRGDDDQLRMSRAMAAYHPGQGRYRSAYMNAMRLARSEINIAYRSSDSQTAQEFDACVGIEVHLSNNHNCKGVPEGEFYDICDELQGKYPKDFKFVGWHPQCYSDDSEVYTAEGWKYFSEVDDNDLILSLNPKTKATEWTAITDMQCYEHSGTMIHFKGREIDCLVTPEHRMVFLNHDGDIGYSEAKDFTKSHGAFIIDIDCDLITWSFTKTQVEYSGKVYDLTLAKNHIMYIRRNGKCFWGSNCRCYTTYILKSDEEFWDDIMSGENNESINTVDDVPDNFKKWLSENKERIDKAEKKGTLPYFLRDNKVYWDYIETHATPTETTDTPKLSIKERADIRHSYRTEAEEEAIRQEWAERKAIRNYGKRMLNYMGGISDVDTSDLEKALRGGDVKLIEREARALKALGKEILSLDKLDNPMQVAKATSMAEAKTINSAVTRTLSSMPTELAARKDKLEFEIDWVGREGKSRYPDTWKYSQDAYKKELAFVEHKLEIKSVANSVEDALAYSTTTRSKAFKTLADEMRGILTAKDFDIAAAKAKAAEVNAKYKQLLYDKQYYHRTTAKLPPSSIPHETIADLKARLGNDFPKTLEHLEDAIAKFESKSYLYGGNAKAHKAEIEALMTEIFDKHDLGMNVDSGNMEKILNSWFKNTFETGTSGGYLGSSSTTGKISTSHGRLGAAHKLFGLKDDDLSIDQLPRHDYEKYGNLLDHDILRSMSYGAAKNYGDVEVRFKKDKVIATWTAGDSWGLDFQPTLVSDPRSCSFDNLRCAPDSRNIQTDDLVDFIRHHISGYIELQYHGELTVDCVDSITYGFDLKDSYHRGDLKVAEKWKNIGVKVFYIAQGNLYQL